MAHAPDKSVSVMYLSVCQSVLQSRIQDSTYLPRRRRLNGKGKACCNGFTRPILECINSASDCPIRTLEDSRYLPNTFASRQHCCAWEARTYRCNCIVRQHSTQPRTGDSDITDSDISDIISLTLCASHTHVITQEYSSTSSNITLAPR